MMKTHGVTAETLTARSMTTTVEALQIVAMALSLDRFMTTKTTGADTAAVVTTIEDTIAATSSCLYIIELIAATIHDVRIKDIPRLFCRSRDIYFLDCVSRFLVDPLL